MSSSRNAIIRNIACLGLGLAEGYALAAACTWVITTASLGTFLTFCVWLLAGVLIALSVTPCTEAIARALNDERIDSSIAAAKSFFSRFTSKVAK